MILTTTLILLLALVLLYLALKVEGTTVEIELVSYTNASAGAVCSTAATSSIAHCDYLFMITFYTASSQVTPSHIKTDTFSTKSSIQKIFFPPQLNDDPVENPFNISYSTEANLTVAVSVYDDDYIKDDFISDFNVTVPVSDSMPRTLYNLPKTYFHGTLDMNFKVYCSGNYGGVGCSACKKNYYTSDCSVHCLANSTTRCNPNTGKLECGDGYHGDNCQKFCKPTDRYTCDKNGSRICQNKWMGVNCTCQPLHNFYTCNKTTGEKICLKNRAGVNCSACSSHFYSKNCSVYCKPESGRYSCSRSGKRRCLNQWQGTNCHTCRTNYFGENCTVFCNRTSNYYNCQSNGSKICKTNRVGPNCTNCQAGFYGNKCTVICVQTNRVGCHSNGTVFCKEKWSGVNCTKCSYGYHGNNCSVFCLPRKGFYSCSNNGTKICDVNRKGVDCLECKSHYFGGNCSQSIIYTQETQRRYSFSNSAVIRGMVSVSVVLGSCVTMAAVITIVAIRCGRRKDLSGGPDGAGQTFSNNCTNFSSSGFYVVNKAFRDEES